MMFSSYEVRIDGLQELKSRLYALPDKVEAQVVRGSLVEGARLIRDDARNRAPEYHGDVADGHPAPGTLKKSIIIKYVPERSRGGQFVYLVGVRHGKKYQKMGKKGVNRDAFYWWFVEFGHYTRTRTALARGRGRKGQLAALSAAGKVNFVPGQRFMRGAFEATKQAALDRILATLKDGVLQQART